MQSFGRTGKTNRVMGYDKGGRGNRGGRGRDKRDGFGGGSDDFGGGRISATDLKIDGEPMAVQERAPRDGGFGGGDRGPRAGGAGGAPQRQLTGEKATGTVKFFNAMKGFGFIQRDDGQPDAFVHISAVERAGMPTLNEGDRLSFEIEVDRRGKYAAVNLESGS